MPSKDPQKIKIKNRRCYLKFYYKMTVAQYDDLLAKQDFKCATCKRPADSFERGLAVDHDHRCCFGDRSCGNCIRGLLCPSCNTALGLIKESLQVLSNLVLYLTHSSPVKG